MKVIDIFVCPVADNPVGAVGGDAAVKFIFFIVRVLLANDVLLFIQVILNVKFVRPVAAEVAIVYVLPDEYPEVYVTVSIVKNTFEITFVFPGEGMFDAVDIFELTTNDPVSLDILIYNLFI